MKISFLFAIGLALFCFFPPQGVWEILASLKFRIQYDEKKDDIVFIPKPSPALRSLEGKVINVYGYSTELFLGGEADASKHTIMLCRVKEEDFGCTMGMEACIEVFLQKEYNLKDNERYLFKGKFELNAKDYLRVPFLLKEAECLNCEEK